MKAFVLAEWGAERRFLRRTTMSHFENLKDGSTGLGSFTAPPPEWLKSKTIPKPGFLRGFYGSREPIDVFGRLRRWTIRVDKSIGDQRA